MVQNKLFLCRTLGYYVCIEVGSSAEKRPPSSHAFYFLSDIRDSYNNNKLKKREYLCKLKTITKTIE